jgi:hypothetical protein
MGKYDKQSGSYVKQTLASAASSKIDQDFHPVDGLSWQ